jgi:hypothetical protein
MAEITKKEALKKIQFLRKTTVARHVTGEVPSKQVFQEFAKDVVEEFNESLAISLVRGKNARFVSKEEQAKFEESERSRLADGGFLNDRERDAWLRSQNIEIEKAPAAV